jgi:hypothetical protein
MLVLVQKCNYCLYNICMPTRAAALLADFKQIGI